MRIRSPTTYRAIDRLTKLAGLVMIAAALGGVVASPVGSLLLAIGGLGVGVVTAFIEPDDRPTGGGERPTRNDEGSTQDGEPTVAESRSDAIAFYARFTHPTAAFVASVGLFLWVADFLVAAVGLLLRGSHPQLAVELFRLAGVVGVVGVLLVAVPAVYLGLLFVRRFAAERTGGSPPR